MNGYNRTVTILMADDDADDRFLMFEALQESSLANDFRFVENGEQLMDYLYHRNNYKDKSVAPEPNLILLDLNMPKKDGWEALQEIKADFNLRHIPIIVLTTSKEEEDIFRTYNLGASSFISKPTSFQALVDMLKALGQYWFDIVKLPNNSLDD